MSSPARKKASRDWYSVSVASLVRLGLLIGLATVLFVGFMAFRRWEEKTLARRAGEQVERAGRLEARLLQDATDEATRQEMLSGRKHLETARGELDDNRFQRALESAKAAADVFESILEREGHRGFIRALNVQGNVEYRRGNQGTWRRLRSNDTLSGGDWVKTGADGSARLQFPDQSVFTARPDTLIQVPAAAASSDANELEIPFGELELTTSRGTSRVKTPVADAVVEENTEALVSFNRDNRSARYASWAGGAVEVRSTGGDVATVEALQQVSQDGESLGNPTPLPGKPLLDEPDSGREFDYGATKRLRLTWKPVSGASRYALRISRDRLFASNLIDVTNRTKTRATLDIRGEGTFYWQVAALDRQGTRGPWSEVRTFRVAALEGVTETDDETPPLLEVTGAETYGSIVIVNGRSEAGAVVTVNGEPVGLAADGSFSKTIQIVQDGWGFIDLTATDAAGNTSRVRQRVFIEGY